MFISLKPLKIFALTIFTMLSVASFVHGDLDNTGIIRNNDLKLNDHVIINTGKIIGVKTLTINCHHLSGNGYIKSPIIIINTRKFDFTGTIECSKESSLKQHTNSTIKCLNKLAAEFSIIE